MGNAVKEPAFSVVDARVLGREKILPRGNVVPIASDGQLIAVLDLDSPRTDRFTEEDEAGCVRLGKILSKVL